MLAIMGLLWLTRGVIIVSEPSKKDDKNKLLTEEDKVIAITVSGIIFIFVGAVYTAFCAALVGIIFGLISALVSLFLLGIWWTLNNLVKLIKKFFSLSFWKYIGWWLIAVE